MSHHEDRNAHAAFQESTYAGCHGASCQQGRRPCKDRCGAEMSCAELDKLRPLVRRPAPRKPHLPLWTRVKLWADQHPMDFLVLLGAGGYTLLMLGVLAALIFSK